MILAEGEKKRVYFALCLKGSFITMPTKLGRPTKTDISSRQGAHNMLSLNIV